MEFSKKLIADVGIEPERFEMFNMSASMATAFVDAVTEMTERAKRLGPNPLYHAGGGDGADEAKDGETQ